MSMTCTMLQENAAMTLYMNYYNTAILRLCKMQDQKLWTLCWHSFSEWGSKGITVVFATKGGQYLIYGCLQPITTKIPQNEKPQTLAKCILVREPYANLPDTLVALASALKCFQMLPASSGALQSALRLYKSSLTFYWKYLHWWRCIQDATKFEN